MRNQPAPMRDGVIELPKNCDDQPCMKCGEIALDTGWECTECGYDNMPWYYPEGAKRLSQRDKKESTDAR